jgi:hypothetical protein
MSQSLPPALLTSTSSPLKESSSPSPEASNPPLESLREATPLPSSPTFNLTPIPREANSPTPPSPHPLNFSSLDQRDALPEQDERQERDVVSNIEEEKLCDVGEKSSDIEEEKLIPKEDPTLAEEVKKEATKKLAKEEEEDFLVEKRLALREFKIDSLVLQRRLAETFHRGKTPQILRSSPHGRQSQD